MSDDFRGAGVGLGHGRVTLVIRAESLSGNY